MQAALVGFIVLLALGCIVLLIGCLVSGLDCMEIAYQCARSAMWARPVRNGIHFCFSGARMGSPLCSHKVRSGSSSRVPGNQTARSCTPRALLGQIHSTNHPWSSEVYPHKFIWFDVNCVLQECFLYGGWYCCTNYQLECLDQTMKFATQVSQVVVSLACDVINCVNLVDSWILSWVLILPVYLLLKVWAESRMQSLDIQFRIR